MGRFLGGMAAVLMLTAVTVPAGAQSDQPVVIRGTGAAHGFGLAMDGVEGQARAGWTHTRILDLFYNGSQTGTAGGTIRVGLTSGGTQQLGLPGGGEISDRPFGTGAGAGFPRSVRVGGGVRIAESDGGLDLDMDETPATAAPKTGAGIKQLDPSEVQDDVVPSLLPSPDPTPTPKPVKTPGASKVPTRATSLFIKPAGDPAITALGATGRRYRGVLEVRRISAGVVRVINHVDLETYVTGIAEEKGQGWPIEAQKVLAIAARTLGAATMGWYGKHHAEGYDICPSGNCQVYLGYDGEEPALRQAVAETHGQIRTYNGRPLMAMYHGNGGGQTETYAKVADGGGTPHPYLKSVKYPHADPSRWEKRTTLTEIAAKLRAQGVDVPRPLQLVEVAEHGDSPRAIRVRVAGGRDEQALVRGTTFASAMGLRSTWFEVEVPKREVATVRAEAAVVAPSSDPTALPRPLGLGTLAQASVFPWRTVGYASIGFLLVIAGALFSGPISKLRPTLVFRRRRS